MSTEHIIDRLGYAFVGNFKKVNAREVFQFSTSDLHACRRIPIGHVTFFGFHDRQKLFGVLSGKVRFGDQSERRGDVQRDRREVLDRIVIELFKQTRIGGHGGVVAPKNRVSIGRRSGGFGCRNRTLGSGLIINHDRLAQCLLQTLAHNSGNRVRCTASGKRHDKANGLARISTAQLGLCWRSEKRQAHDHTTDKPQSLAHPGTPFKTLTH